LPLTFIPALPSQFPLAATQVERYREITLRWNIFRSLHSRDLSNAFLQ
jgi:hypothetical protein